MRFVMRSHLAPVSKTQCSRQGRECINLNPLSRVALLPLWEVFIQATMTDSGAEAAPFSGGTLLFSGATDWAMVNRAGGKGSKKNPAV